MSVLAVTPTQSALTAAAYMRIVSLSIAGYEYVTNSIVLPFIVTHSASYILTLPSEYRLYKSPARRR